MSAQRNVSLLSLAGVYCTTKAIASLTGIPEPVVDKVAKELEAKQSTPPPGLIHLKLFNKHFKKYAKQRWYADRKEQDLPGGPGRAAFHSEDGHGTAK